MRTASAAQAAFRPWVFASTCSDAAASFTTFRRKSLWMLPPPTSIGVDEPMLVCGAIARTSAAWPIQTPAEAARAPSGDDVDDHRDLRRKLLLVDPSHRLRQAARRVEHDCHRRVPALVRAVDLPGQVPRGDRVDVVLENDRQHFRRRRLGRAADEEDGRDHGQRGEKCPQESRFHSRKDSIKAVSSRLPRRAHWLEGSPDENAP